jgi:uncharacterized protein involved in type VI secretion and phage assembly
MSASYIKIGGELVQDAVLMLVEVDQKLNQHWWCRVECRQSSDRRIAVEDALGKDFQVLTKDQQGAEHILFDGFVLDSELDYEIYGSFLARITGVTHSYKLDVAPQEAYFRKKTLQDVANALTAEDGLSADITVPAKPPKNYVQWGETDFTFLLRMADDHHAWIRPTPRGIQIFDKFQSGTQVEWCAEDGLVSFEVTGRLAAPSFSGTHYSARSMKSSDFQGVQKAPEFTGAGGRMVAAVQRASADVPSGYIHLDPRAATSDEYKELLERESVRSIGAGIFARGRSFNEAVQAGCTLEVSGPIDAKGTYGVTEVLHRWTRTGYHNEFRCTPWKNFLAPKRPDPKPMRGLVTARVVDHNDPRKMGRVKVQYDWQEDGETGWIRMTTPHAGADRGFMFMPEKGDEVLVAFEHGDAERPYVVGCLWNGVDQAPRSEFWGGDIENNDVKRIVTKSGHRIQLSDKEGKEAIVIATPSKLKIAMLEKADETGRSMILMHSADGDIFVSAPKGRVHFRSKYFSREVGAAGSTSGAGGGGAAGGSAAHSLVGPGADAGAAAASTGHHHAAAVAAAAVGTKKKKKTWVEIKLVDGDGKPVAGEPYRIELPDGEVRNGTLNSQGLARIEGIDPGACKITFPKRDKRDWRKH